MATMNLGLQKNIIKRKLRNAGISTDKVDLEAELDSTLSLPENIQNLEQKYGKLERTGRNTSARQEQAKGRRRRQAKRHAKQFHQQRPKYNRYIDMTKTADKTFRDPTERQMKKWKNNPNKYDIEGVDTRKDSARRPQAELPFKRKRDKKGVLYRGSRSDLKKSMRKIPASIKRNAEGQKERLAKKFEDQGFEKYMAEKERMAVPQNALVGNFDLPEVMEEDRQRRKDQIEMTKFEREERLEADSNSRASRILDGDGTAFSSSKPGKKWEGNYR